MAPMRVAYESIDYILNEEFCINSSVKILS